MYAATGAPSTRVIDVEKLILKSENFVRDKIIPVLDAEPALRVGPLAYSHAVKFPGHNSVSLDQIVQSIRKEINQSNEITLYCHVPVCRYHCTFCHYPTLVSSDPQRAASYIDLLIAEGEVFKRQIPEVNGKRLSSFYVGGGTPTLAAEADLRRLMEHVRASFELSNSAEVTIEATPETLPPPKIQELIQLGFNRISVGAQILDDTKLTEYHRKHTAAQALAAVAALVETNAFKVNVDLIYGLPNQTIDQFAGDVKEIADLRPTSITLYRLRLQRSDELGKTGMSKAYESNPLAFPSQETTYAMQIVGREILTAYGSIERPSGWFSLPGNTIRVYDDRWYRQLPLISFGWWTYSYSGSYEYRNQSNIQEYRSEISQGRLPLAECYEYDELERCRRFFQFRLKSCYAIRLSDLISTQENGAHRLADHSTATDYYSRQLNRLVSLGLANRFPDTLVLTDIGKVMIEEILSALV